MNHTTDAQLLDAMRKRWAKSAPMSATPASVAAVVSMRLSGQLRAGEQITGRAGADPASLELVVPRVSLMAAAEAAAHDLVPLTVSCRAVTE